MTETTQLRQQTDQKRMEVSLRVLEAAGFDVKALWCEHESRVAQAERGVPTEDDKRYELPLECPQTESHLAGGNEELAPARLWNGLSYTLSSGMRGLLRDKYGMTPTKTVTVVWVEPWPGTRFPRRMLLKSDVHVDPRARRHVLTEVVVDGVGTFFRLAKERDEAKVEAGRSELVDESLASGRVLTLKSEDRWAVEDLCGVKVMNKVEVLRLSADDFTLLCLKSGKKATVRRKLFFTTVEEYCKLYATGRPKRGQGADGFGPTPSLDAVLAELMKK